MTTLIYGTTLHIVADPAPRLQVTFDAAIAISEEGIILDHGPKSDIKKKHSQPTNEHDYGKALILPTFIDCHSHFPQLDMIGEPASGLLTWLSQTTFPREATFSDPAIAKDSADFFTDCLLRNGIGAACLFSSSHLEATEILAATCLKKGLRAIIGRSSMDRGAPENILTTVEQDLVYNERLITNWHNKHRRLHIALTPRFAPACTEAMLEGLGDLRAKDPSLYVQTHHSENDGEIRLVRELFPKDKDYLSVYHRFGLLGERTILAHAIHAEPAEMDLMVQTNSIVAHCPTSNLFLASGLFPYKEYQQRDARIVLGTDIGAGTSFSMWQTMNEAYKVAQLKGFTLPLTDLFFNATLGAAQALGWQDRCGSIEKGKDADLQVLDPRRLPLMQRRLQERKGALSEEQLLASLVFLADDRMLSEIYLQGERKSFGPTPVPT